MNSSWPTVALCSLSGLKNIQIGTTPYPERGFGLSPPRGAERGGNAQQHGTQVAVQEDAEIDAPAQNSSPEANIKMYNMQAEMQWASALHMECGQ
jgi:hypothetical protein